MISVEDTQLRGGGSKLKQEIWGAARDTIQEWTDQELTECSLYGIRVYTEGAVLATHVDRLPLVSSAIVNVAQDVDEPWPIEVIGRDGRAYNVTMEPGDMVLYESHSTLHGRPFPLKGRFYANIFIHFEPNGHSLRHKAQVEGGDVHEKYKDSVSKQHGGHEAAHNGLPEYIKVGSNEEKEWHKRHPDNRRSEKMNSFTTGSTAAHRAAQDGDVDGLIEIIDKLGHLVNSKDENGWTPLHEGARTGNLEVVRVLLDKGSRVNERTQGEDGLSPLYIAREENGDDHPIVELIESFGGISLGPEL
jgi:prolyl 4-hydroxylase